ncbi:hypothetical protein HMI54_013839 [Coelomomyces lativittatus]|nr:hypothetical protein HMI56_000390 [Coelomomyces lativittatus]KAJ1514617.1 hypothetical protein HMI54_013839 [Coelomomyces lativittatus]KAJ1517289.1 hypothetical protein HMI55_000152 [Coelomomyces lativittatus]
MRLGRLSSQSMVHVQKELLQEKGSSLRFSDIAALQICINDILHQENQLNIDQFALGNLSIGVDHEQAELVMKILDSKDVLDTLISSNPTPPSTTLSFKSMQASSSMVTSQETSPVNLVKEQLFNGLPTASSSSTSSSSSSSSVFSPLSSPPHLNEIEMDFDLSTSLASMNVEPTSAISVSPPPMSFLPSPFSSTTSESPMVTQLLSPSLIDINLPSYQTPTLINFLDLSFMDDPPEHRYHLPVPERRSIQEANDEYFRTRLARYDSDATVLATEDVMLSLSRDSERMTVEGMHGVIGFLDQHHGTLFREFILNPDHTELCARQLHALASHVSVTQLARVVSWMVSAEPSETFQTRAHAPWPTLAMAKLLTILTMDTTPDVAGLFFRLVWVNAYLSKSTAIKVTSMMVQDEPPSIAALFVKTFSVSWSLLHVAELISFLDCTLHWTETYFTHFMERYFAYLKLDPPTHLPPIMIEEFSSDVFQLNAALVLTSSPHMRVVFLTTLYKTNLALNQMKMEYVADQLRMVASQLSMEMDEPPETSSSTSLRSHEENEDVED